MKGYVRMILVATLLLLSTALLASLTISPLWPSGNTWKVPDKTGPTIIAKASGNMLFLSRDGALYELTMSGALKSYGQVTGITNVVAPATYFTFGGKNYITYVTAQGTAQNRLVVHEASESKKATPTSISSSAYGVVAQVSVTSVYIYTATMDGTVYQVPFDGDLGSAATVTVNAPVKIPPVLSKDGKFLYVMTQNGVLYKIETSTFNNPDDVITLGGEFTVPMAMDEDGYLYALNSSGVLYKIDPSGTERHAGTGLTSSDSAGVLIDGDGSVYVFGGGKVFVFNGVLTNMTPGGYSTGQKITTTPAIVKGTDGVTYVIVPSSASESSGKITILAFNPTVGTLTLERDWEMSSSFPISAAVGVAPVNALNGNYYFATATNDGTVYAWQFDARGPYGIWATYGQNTNHTGFIDAAASLFKTRIKLIAKEGFNGYALGSNFMGSQNYGLLYDATVLNADNTVASSKTNLRTNEEDLSKIPEGVPGSQKLEVKFATPTTSTLLFSGNFKDMMKGKNPPATDSEFEFRMWQTSGSEGYEWSETDNPATLTYRFNDRTVNLFTDATYTFYVYHKYPLTGSNSEATETIDAVFDYNTYKSNPQAATQGATATLDYLSKQWYAFKWNVYQWNPEAPNGLYDYDTYNDRDSISLPIKGPAYIEIYYAQLSSTITLLLPDFAYGKTRAYLFLDAATDAVTYTIEATTLQGITIDSVESAVFDSNVGGYNWESTVTTSNHLKYVFDSIQTPLPGTTRVATLALNLSVPQGVEFSGLNNESFERYFDMYGYAQLRNQQVEPEALRAKKVYEVNHFLYVVGDFNNDFTVDMNDWNFFVDKYGETVSGTDSIYNIGPRERFSGPTPNYSDYRAGILTDKTNKVDNLDLNYFAVMFGFVVPESERVK